MLLYNITLIAEDQVATACLQWLKNAHVPAIRTLPSFISHQLFQLVDSPNEGQTYCLQFLLRDKEAYHQEVESLSASLLQELQQQYPNQVFYFSSLMVHLD